MVDLPEQNYGARRHVDYVVVIPAFNEIRTIRDVVARTLAQGIAVIVVDDGSSDGTAEALDGMPVQLLLNEQNQGKAASLWRGFEAAKAAGARAVITLDADGQHYPEDIPRLIQAHRTLPDHIVIGSRLHAREKIPVARYRANRFANFWIGWAAGYPIHDSQSGFRIYPIALFERLQLRHDRASGFVFESEILIEAGRQGIYSIAVPISVSYGEHHRGSYFRPVIDIVRIARMIAAKLLMRGMYLQGLVRSLRRSGQSGVPITRTSSRRS